MITISGPKSGPIRGGTRVKITVTDPENELDVHLDEDTLLFSVVKFGENAATDVQLVNWNKKKREGTISAISPPRGRAEKKVDIAVVAPGGNDIGIERDAFTYAAAEVISVEPKKGTLDDAKAGNIVVVIKGSNFGDVKAVKFGGKNTKFNLRSDSEIWALVPESATPEAVDVIVETESWSEKKVFTYTPATAASAKRQDANAPATVALTDAEKARRDAAPKAATAPADTAKQVDATTTAPNPEKPTGDTPKVTR
jgi:hypothetical protein